jgi:hypothetical protein
MMALPAFGGIDEFDHVYRAASVARGHWDPPLVAAKGGPGDLIPVPVDLVRAAANRCSILPYTGPENCYPVSSSGAGVEVLVASTAARYNPAYPWLVGTAALPFKGATALYVIRGVTTLLCDLLLVATWWLLGRAATTAWPQVAAITALTPVVLYASTNAAPNGLQMCAGLLMWTAGLALSRAEPRKAIVWAFALATSVLMTVHTTGPMWATATVVSLAVWPGTVGAAQRTWRALRPTCVGAIAFLVVVGLADLWWSLTHSTNMNWGNHHFRGPSASTLLYAFPLWIFQGIGSIPFRDQYVPTAVFAIALVGFGLLIFLAFRRASQRERLVIIAIGAAFFVIPLVLTVISFHSLGLAWQGRYALPFACGLPLLAGWVLDAAPPRAPLSKVAERMLPFAFCLAQGIALCGVVGKQKANWPEHHGLGAPPILLLVGLTAVASVLVWVGFEGARRGSNPVQRAHDVRASLARD